MSILHKENKVNTRWIHTKFKTKDFKKKCDAEKCLQKVVQLAPEYSWTIQEYCYMSL